MLSPHIQLGRDALHALSLGAAGYALFGGASAAQSIAYVALAVLLHVAAHGLILAGRIAGETDHDRPDR